MSTDSYITALTNKLKSISSLLDEKRAEVKKILEKIHGLENQANSLLNLLEVEGYSVDEFGLEIQSSMSVSDRKSVV